jgi:23S rRNA pseudouridine1911/1915/1917 synthase
VASPEIARANGRGWTSRRPAERLAAKHRVEPLLNLVHEDDDLLVVNKPAGLVCHPTKGDAYSSLISRVRLHLGPNAAPTLINRLDRETSGLVLIAHSERADAGIKSLFTRRLVTKEYLAIAHGHVAADTFECAEPLGPDEASAVAIKDRVRPDGKAARTKFTIVRRFTRAEGDFTLLRVGPDSGRKHQIRIHLAHLGHPLVGDKLYGGDERLYLAFVERRLTAEQRAQLLLPCHALHAGLLKFRWRQEDREFRAEPEPWFHDFIEGKPLADDWAERYR